jgi:hypothetical protein
VKVGKVVIVGKVVVKHVTVHTYHPPLNNRTSFTCGKRYDKTGGWDSTEYLNVTLAKSFVPGSAHVVAMEKGYTKSHF